MHKHVETTQFTARTHTHIQTQRAVCEVDVGKMASPQLKKNCCLCLGDLMLDDNKEGVTERLSINDYLVTVLPEPEKTRRKDGCHIQVYLHL